MGESHQRIIAAGRRPRRWLRRWPRSSHPCPATATYLQSKMTDSDIYWTFVTAQKYGGKFFQQLGNAGLAGNPIDKRLILNTWPMIVATYGVTSRLHRQLRHGVAV